MVFIISTMPSYILLFRLLSLIISTTYAFEASNAYFEPEGEMITNYQIKPFDNLETMYHATYNDLNPENLRESEAKPSRNKPIISFSKHQTGFIGCLYEDRICDKFSKEVCFDDNLLGKCLGVNSNIMKNPPTKYPSMKMGKDLLEKELNFLFDSGYTWSDMFTQCRLQIIINEIWHSIHVSNDICNIFAKNDFHSQSLKKITEDQNFKIMEPDNIVKHDLIRDTSSEQVLPVAVDDTKENDYWIDDVVDGGKKIFYPNYDPKLMKQILDEEDHRRVIPIEDRNKPKIDLEEYTELNSGRSLSDYYDSAMEDQVNDRNTLKTDSDEDDQEVKEFFHFNRRGRLDVKKPGPVFSSPKRYENTKFDLTGLPISPFSQKFGKTMDLNEKGQVEFESPILSSVKPKRYSKKFEEDLILKKDRKNYVQIKIKNRFNTWFQATKFINQIAQEMNLPQNAFNDRTIKSKQVSFHIRKNPLDIGPKELVERIANDNKLKKKIADSIGVEIDEAVQVFDGTDNKLNGLPLNQDWWNRAVDGMSSNMVSIIAGSLSAALILFGILTIWCCFNFNCGGKKKEKSEKIKSALDRKLYSRDCSRKNRNVTGSGTQEYTKFGHKRKESNGSGRSSTSSWNEDAIGTNSMDISTGHMVLSYMEDHLKNKQRLEQEWVALCAYEPDNCSTSIAFMTENKKKNRFPDKLPFDHNRILLNKENNFLKSDYINASAITDHDPRNPRNPYYIVTQSPLSETVSDFWQLVWEQGSLVIVLLTKIQDKGYQMCYQYWPSTTQEAKLFHIFEVNLVSEHIWSEEYLVRSFYLKNTKTGQTRTVTQFHFRSWPLEGVPESTKALLEFRRKVNKSYRGRSCPVIVQCSDGAGRSGTYVLLDMVLNRMSRGCKEIDIAATLEHIRDQRQGMVQTKKQFEFCLMAVAEEVHAILKAMPQ